ncbi:TraX family protein [Ruminococcus sp.]|uniref:TraX family protein n=1 Tax=Ruminococcus sp. TaxID=41978 RepID=UPI0025D87C6F|nr:TraX family protein [Ruminococcus sp.]MBQ8966735.1 hypothetical protein [Ruminococcus sp.]
MEDTKKSIKIFNRDMMKYMALIPMAVGHAVAWINLMHYPDDSEALYRLSLPLLIITGLAMFCPPVMFFFITDGYKYTRDRKKYAERLLVFALITQPFDWLIFKPIYGWWTSNVIFTLFFGLLAIMAWESRFRLWQRVLLVILCAGATVLLHADWMIFGVLFILVLHIFREKPKARCTAYSILALIHVLLNLPSLGSVPTGKLLINMFVTLCMFAAAYLCMTVFYNGKKSSHPVFAKWFFYIFYPAHYLVIYLIKLCMDRI